jgi:hypothetical protein
MISGGQMQQGKKSEPAIEPIAVPAIHPRQRARRGAAQAENARLTKALARCLELASLEPGCIDRGKAWEALGGIKYVCATALRGES